MADDSQDIQELGGPSEGSEAADFELPEFHSRLLTDILYSALSVQRIKVEESSDLLALRDVEEADGADEGSSGRPC